MLIFLAIFQSGDLCSSKNNRCFFDRKLFYNGVILPLSKSLQNIKIALTN